MATMRPGDGSVLFAGRERLLHRGERRPTPVRINYYEWCEDHNKPLENRSVGRLEPAVRRLCPIPTF